MPKTDFTDVDDYLAAQPEAARAALELVRGAIRRALPEAEERISYQIPSYRLAGRAVLHFGGWKRHYALYPASERVVATFESALEPYSITKGTIRFPLGEPVPVDLIEGIAKLRAEEVAERKKTTPGVAERKLTTPGRSKEKPT